MTDWQETVNQLTKKARYRNRKQNHCQTVGLRCWECGLYIKNTKTTLLCNSCLTRYLTKLDSQRNRKAVRMPEEKV